MASPPEPGTRDRILEVSLQLFSAQGFAGTSMRQIAVGAGMRASSLYNHFAGKEAIFAALIDSHGPAISAARLASPGYRALGRDPAAFCQKYASDLLMQWSDPQEQRFMALLSAERRHMSVEQTHFFDTLFSREVGAVTEYFCSFALNRLIRAPDPAECARLFMAGLTFLRMEHFLILDRPSPAGEVRMALDRFVTNFVALIAPTPAPSVTGP